MVLNSNKKRLGIILAIVAFYVIFTIYFEFEKTITNFQNLNLYYIPILLFLILASLICLGIRQNFILNSISVKIGIKENILIFFSGLTMLTTPGGSGQAIKSLYLKNRHGANYSKTLPIVIIERYLDLFAIITIIGILSIFRNIIEAQIIFVVFVCLLIFGYFLIRNKILFDYILKFTSKIKRLEKFNDTISKSRETFLIAGTWKTMLVAYGLSILAWVLHSIVVILSFEAFSIDFNPLDSILLTFTSLLIGVASLIPGGIGLTEASMAGLFIKYGIESDMASSLTLLIRVVTIWFSVIVGFISTRFVVRKIKN